MEHNVTMRNAPTPDDEGKGMQAIVRTMLKNPVATVELLMFIGAGYGLYYANTSAINDVKAAGETHYTELKNIVAANNERVIAKLEAAQASDASQTAKIEAIFARGDTRWGTVTSKLNEQDVKFARLESAVNYLVRVLDKNAGGAVPEIGPLPSK